MFRLSYFQILHLQGSGKTLAFGIPVLARILEAKKKMEDFTPETTQDPTEEGGEEDDEEVQVLNVINKRKLHKLKQECILGMFEILFCLSYIYQPSMSYNYLLKKQKKNNW